MTLVPPNTLPTTTFSPYDQTCVDAWTEEFRKAVWKGLTKQYKPLAGQTKNLRLTVEEQMSLICPEVDKIVEEMYKAVQG